MGVYILSRFSKKKNVAKPTEERQSLASAIREALNIAPDDVNGLDNARVDFYRGELMRTLKGHIEIKAPDNWDRTYMKEALLIGTGYFTVTEKDSDPLPLKCSAYGVNVFERPTNVTVANVVLGNFTRTIGEDCELVFLEGRGHGFVNLCGLIDVYAQKLANCDKAIDVNLFNTMTTIIFAVKNSKVAQAIRLMFQKISQGEPAVFVDKDTEINDPSNIITLRAKENYVADVVQLEKDAIMNEFLTRVGINNANTEKRERLITDEVNANNDEIIGNAKEWNDNLELCCKKVRKMFPSVGNFSIKFVNRSTVDRESEVTEDDNAD